MTGTPRAGASPRMSLLDAVENWFGGRSMCAARLLTRIKEMRASGHLPFTSLAMIHAALGDTHRALFGNPANRSGQASRSTGRDLREANHARSMTVLIDGKPAPISFVNEHRAVNDPNEVGPTERVAAAQETSRGS